MRAIEKVGFAVTQGSADLNDTMLAAVFGGEGKLEIQPRPVPRVQRPDDVLIEVEGCGICGTDLHILDVPPGHPATPGAIMGHEFLGRVVAIGAEVSDIVPGQRVAVAPNITCGRCRYCRMGRPNQCENWTTLGIFLDGGLARYSVAPARNVFPIADHVPLTDAVWTEVLSCVVGATRQVRAQPGETALVIGAGPVGVLFGLVFKASGARVIISDLAPFRLEMARRARAGETVDVREQDVLAAVMKATGLGVDIAVDAVGTQFQTCIEACARGGRIALFGMNQAQRPTVSQYDITRHELTVYGSYVGVNTFPGAIRMLESGTVRPGPLVTHILPVSRIQEGLAAARAGEAMKVLITPE